MDKNDERALDNAVESLLGEVAVDGPIHQSVVETGDARALLPVLFTLGHAVELLHRQVGRLDARLHALDGEE